MNKLLVGIFVLVIALPSFSQNSKWPVWLEKKYNQTFTVNNKTIKLYNMYGKMTIETWDKNELQVDVVINVGAKNNETAERVLGLISIIENQDAETIEVKTKFENERNGSWDENGSREMKVVYKVYMPKTATLIAENNFGDIEIEDFDGTLTAICKYGALSIGNLKQASNIQVDFGKAQIQSLVGVKLKAQYSKIDIEKISGDIDAKLSFCESVDFVVSLSTKNINITSDYTSVYLDFEKDFSATYNVVTAYGSLNNSTPHKIQERKNNASNHYYTSTKKYEGSFGSNTTNPTQIKIKSNYGSVKFKGA